jgi:hypothetical protein
MRVHYTHDVGYFWLPVTLAMLRGVSPQEVLQALNAQRRYPVPGYSPEGISVLAIWARARTGRPLVVALRRIPDGGRDWWIIGARDLDDAELTRFEQWETKGGDGGD